MALLKQISTDHGVYASYWKITGVVFNLNGSCTISVTGFYTQDTRNSNQQYLRTLQYTVSHTDMETVFQTGFNLYDAYEYLKTTPEFSFGSEDV